MWLVVFGILSYSLIYFGNSVNIVCIDMVVLYVLINYGCIGVGVKKDFMIYDFENCLLNYGLNDDVCKYFCLKFNNKLFFDSVCLCMFEL